MSIKMLVLSLTGQCNFACRYCYAAEHDRSMMSPETALAAVRLAADGGERFVIQFSGGEPLLNFDCLKAVVDYVHQEKFLPYCSCRLTALCLLIRLPSTSIKIR